MRDFVGVDALRSINMQSHRCQNLHRNRRIIAQYKYAHTLLHVDLFPLFLYSFRMTCRRSLLTTVKYVFEQLSLLPQTSCQCCKYMGDGMDYMGYENSVLRLLLLLASTRAC